MRAWPGPRRSVESLVRRIGADDVLRACLELLDGREVDGQIVHALGGPPAAWAVGGGEPGPDYWLRVWALRALLWHWDARAIPATVRALTDESWRVREMAAKVAARHVVDEALGALTPLRQDAVPRVRVAAVRAIERITRQGGQRLSH